VLAVAILALTSLGDAQTPAAPQFEQIITHLESTIAWFRRIQAVEQQATLAGDVVSRDRLHQTSTTSLQLAFDYARAAVPLVNPPTAASPNAPPADDRTGRGFDQAAARLGQRVASLQSRLTEVSGEISRAPARSRAALAAERDELTAALALAKDVQATVDNLARFAATSSGASEAARGLTGQIDDLERSVPEARHTQSAKAVAAAARPAPAAPAAAAAASLPPFRPDSAGLVALATELFSIQGDRSQLRDLLRETDALAKEIEDLRAPFGAEARDLVRRTNVDAEPSSNPSQAEQRRRELEDAAARFKTLAAALLPLGEQGIAVEASRGTLAEWRDDLSERFTSTARYLLLRAGVLVAVLGVLLVVSEMWRRATFRYLQDSRRRRQFLILRRVVIGATFAIVLVMGFVSEIGSLATYAGFVTAGIAVAMQNVILAVVAYFFLIGRYGVRVGDRITLAGITGNVIEIGLVRIYLMELAGADLHATGRIVVLSNAVLFQPAALFKQVPGADYAWHTVTVTLAAGTDIALAEERLEAAAESVYEEYRPAIERQHANLQRFVDVETSVPQPDVHAHLTEAGLECVVRYPVDVQRSAWIDRAIVEAIRRTLASEPKLTVVSSTGPRLQQTA
jgi:small-conductance mechanosensitive channel